MRVFEKFDRFRLSIILGILFSIETLSGLVVLRLMPTDLKNAIFMGFSLFRLLVMAVLFFFLVLFLGLMVLGGFKKNKWIDQTVDMLAQNGIVFGVAFYLSAMLTIWGAISIFLPTYSLGRYGGYFERARPIFIWMGLIAFQLWLSLSIWKNGFHFKELVQGLRTSRWGWGTWLVGMLLILILFLVVVLSGLGFVPDTWGWNPPETPVMAWQIGISLVILLVGGIITQRLGKIKYSISDGLIFIVIWVLAAILWNIQPQYSHFFNPGPNPPDNSYFPMSDATVYDAAAQFALIGEGLMGGHRVDKPLYSTLLVFLNLIGGNSFTLVLHLQSTLMAIWPALGYLIGKKIHSRGAGLLTAALIIFKEINAGIATQWIVTANSRVIMSEVPTALAMATITWLGVRWFKEKHPGSLLPVFMGGFLGISIGLRHNVWALLPLFLLLPWWKYFKQLRKAALTSLLILAAFFVSSLPWAIRSLNQQGVFYSALIPLQRVVFQNRFKPILEKPDVYQATQEAESDGLPAEGGDNASSKNVNIIINTVSAHFVHNLISGLYILPSSPELDDITHVFKEPGNVWGDDPLRIKTNFNGWMVLNLGIILLGICTATHTSKKAAFVPVGIIGFYFLANSVARTSGGRYLVPVDWIYLLYFSMGVLACINGMSKLLGIGKENLIPAEIETSPDTQPKKQGRLVYVILQLGAVFLMGAVMPVSEGIFPLKYPHRTQVELVQSLVESGVNEKLGYTGTELMNFLTQNNSRISEGRLVYPRYYARDEGQPYNETFEAIKPFPRLAFMIIGPVGHRLNYLLPLEKVPGEAIHTKDAFVISCGQQALALVIKGEDGRMDIYKREPATALQCPIRWPECDGNGKCW